MSWEPIGWGLSLGRCELEGEINFGPKSWSFGHFFDTAKIPCWMFGLSVHTGCLLGGILGYL